MYSCTFHFQHKNAINYVCKHFNHIDSLTYPITFFLESNCDVSRTSTFSVETGSATKCRLFLTIFNTSVRTVISTSPCLYQNVDKPVSLTTLSAVKVIGQSSNRSSRNNSSISISNDSISSRRVTSKCSNNPVISYIFLTSCFKWVSLHKSIMVGHS